MEKVLVVNYDGNILFCNQVNFTETGKIELIVNGPENVIGNFVIFIGEANKLVAIGQREAHNW